VNPTVQAHAGQPQDLSHPTRALTFQDQQQSGNLQPFPSSWDLLGQGKELFLRG
jgi:hypothetical protein